MFETTKMKYMDHFQHCACWRPGHQYHKTVIVWSSFIPKHYIRSEQHEKKYVLKKHEPGGRLNKKDGLTRYGDSHVKDKTS